MHRQLTTATRYQGDGLVIPPDRLQLVNWTFSEEASEFVSLADHCAYRQLLHLPGNSYAGAVCLGAVGAADQQSAHEQTAELTALCCAKLCHACAAPQPP